MESLVVSLETAQKLKAAGFGQNTWQRWLYGDAEDRWFIIPDEDVRFGYAAPTAQEIADQLPPQTSLINSDFSLRKRGGMGGYETRWQQTYTKADTIAEALANLWLKLQEAK